MKLYQESQGFFWSCDDACQGLKLEMESNKRIYDSLLMERDRVISEGKSILGVSTTLSLLPSRACNTHCTRSSRKWASARRETSSGVVSHKAKALPSANPSGMLSFWDSLPSARMRRCPSTYSDWCVHDSHLHPFSFNVLCSSSSRP